MGSRDWLGAADPEFCRASGNDAVTCGVDDGEFAGSEREGYGLRSACGEMDALETGEGADRGAVDAGMGHVELDDFIAGEFRAIGDVGRHENGRIATNVEIGRGKFKVSRVGGRASQADSRVEERGVGEAKAERVEGLFGGVAVGAVCHGITGERRELGKGFVESDREAPRGIVIAGKNVGDGGATFFAGVPGFDNSSGMFVSPVDGEGAAAGEDDHQRFTGSGEGFEESLLGGGKSDVRAIAPEETGVAVFGLLAFELGSDANDSDDDVRFARGIDGFLKKIRGEPEKADSGFPGIMKICKVDGIGMAGLEMDERGHGAFPVWRPIVNEEFAVEVQAIAAIGADAETVIAIDGRDEFAGPTRGIVFRGDARGGGNVVPFKVDVAIEASEDGGAGERGVGEEFGGKARSGCGTCDPRCSTGTCGARRNPKSTARNGCATSAEGGSRNRDGASFGDGGAKGRGNLGARETFLNAGEDRGVGGRSAIVVAEESVKRIRGRADDGNRFYGRLQRKSVPFVFE